MLSSQDQWEVDQCGLFLRYKDQDSIPAAPLANCVTLKLFISLSSHVSGRLIMAPSQSW